MSHIKNIRVEFLEMPQSVNGLVVLDKEEYIILINQDKSLEQQEKTYHHELEHIINNDFYKDIPNVSELEFIRHHLNAEEVQE